MLSLKHICLLEVKALVRADIEDIPATLKTELKHIPSNVVSFFKAITTGHYILPSTITTLRPTQFPDFMLRYLSTIKPTNERQYIMKHVVKFNLYNNDALDLLFTHTPQLISEEALNMVALEGIFDEAFALRWYNKLHFGRLKANESFKYTDRFIAAFPLFDLIQQCKGCYMDTWDDVDAYTTMEGEYVCSACFQVLCMECEEFVCICDEYEYYYEWAELDRLYDFF